MGTRSISGVRINGTDKLSYNYFVGYPSAFGATIYEELSAFFKDRDYAGCIGELRHRAHGLRLVTADEKPSDADIHYLDTTGATDFTVASGSVDDWYCLTRQHHGSILKRLMAAIATDEHEFILDSLMCKYGYILNLDDETLEFYVGFQKTRHTRGRYAGEEVENDAAGDIWYPCALVYAYPLKDLLAFPDSAALADDMEAREKQLNEAVGLTSPETGPSAGTGVQGFDPAAAAPSTDRVVAFPVKQHVSTPVPGLDDPF